MLIGPVASRMLPTTISSAAAARPRTSAGAASPKLAAAALPMAWRRDIRIAASLCGGVNPTGRALLACKLCDILNRVREQIKPSPASEPPPDQHKNTLYGRRRFDDRATHSADRPST